MVITNDGLAIFGTDLGIGEEFIFSKVFSEYKFFSCWLWIAFHMLIYLQNVFMIFDNTLCKKMKKKSYILDIT